MNLRSRFLLAIAFAAGSSCGGDKAILPPVVATVELTPGADTLKTLGQMRHYNAVAKDASGVPIPGKEFDWSSSAAGVATVDAASGIVVAVANGTATITATVDGVSAHAAAVVAQAVATVTVTPATTGSIALGATMQFTGAAKDASGAAVAGAALTWSSSNHAIATVDATGLATSTGPGTATITASAQSIPGTAALTVTQTATKVAITIQPSSALAGQAVSPAIQVEIRDANGARVANSRQPVTLALAANPGSASISGSKTVNAVDGIATFTGIALDKVGVGYTLTASSGTLTAETSTAFSITPGTAARLAVSAQPTSGLASAVIAPTVQVTVQDAFGNIVPTATNAVTLSLNSPVAGLALSGSVTRSAVSGVASFDDLKVGGGSTALSLTATASGLASATSAAFDIVPLPLVASFAPAQRTITSGGSTTLTPVYSGGVAAIDHGLGGSVNGGIISTGALTASTTFTLTVTNSLGTIATDTTTVVVVPAPAIASTTAGQTTVTTGASTTITATFTGGTGTLDHGVGPVTSGVAISTGAITAGTTFTLTVTNAAGTSVTSTVTIAAVAAPSIASFTPAQTTVTSGGSTNLSAMFSGGTASISGGLGAVVSGGSVSSGALTASTAFTLTVTNAAGATATSTVSVAVVAAPSIAVFAATQATVTSGSSTVLIAAFAGGTATVDHNVGAVTPGVTTSTGAMSATTTFTLTVTNAAGTSVTAPVTVTVVGSPTITSFVTASGSNVITITRGTNTTLTAVYSGGTASVDHGGGALGSSVTSLVGPVNATTTYTLSVTNAAGAVATSSVTVIAVDAPSITGFTSAGPFVTSGTNASLTPVFSGGIGVIDRGVGQVTSGITASPGTSTLGATGYTLTVTNAAGASVSALVSVTVVAPPHITSFAASRNPVTQNGTTKFAAVFEDGTAFVDPIGPIAVGDSLESGVITGQTAFRLVVENAAGLRVYAPLTINVIPPPTLLGFAFAESASNFIAVTEGSTVTLMTAFAGGTAVVDQGIGAVTSGAQIRLTPPVGNTLYTLTVTNAAGASVTVSAFLTVVQRPTITSFRAAKRNVTAGGFTFLTPVFSGGPAQIIGLPPSGPIVSGALQFAAPVVTTTFTLVVTNALGASAFDTVTVGVVDAPVISSFTASDSAITLGEHATLSPIFSGGVGVINHGVGEVASGILTNTGAPVLGTTTFTLTVKNLADDSVTASIPILVAPLPTIASFDVMQTTITTGSSTSLLPVFQGASAIIDHGIGLVTTGGQYVTPNLTQSTTYTLTVTSAAGVVVTDTLTVTVVPPPVINSFTALPTTFAVGNSSTLSFSFADGVGSISPNVGPVTSGINVQVTPLTAGIKVYTLTVTNAAGLSVQATVSLTVF